MLQKPSNRLFASVYCRLVVGLAHRAGNGVCWKGLRRESRCEMRSTTGQGMLYNGLAKLRFNAV